MDFQTIKKSYLGTLLWSSTEINGENVDTPLDENYDIDDFSDDAIAIVDKDLTEFLEQAKDIFDSVTYEHDDALIGHDFWLTRNHHGAGFWDGDWKQLGDKLTKVSQNFSEQNPYVHNGKIELS